MTKTGLAVFAEVDTATDLRGNAIRVSAARPVVGESDEPRSRSHSSPHRDDPFYMNSAPPPARPTWRGRIRDFLIGKVLWLGFTGLVVPTFLNWHTVKDCAGAGGAVIARLAGWKIEKAPDTDGGRAVTTALGEEPKPNLIGRVFTPLKDAAAKPVEVVKEKGKQAVEKVETKAEAVRDTVKEEAHDIKDALRSKAADIPPGAAPPAAPGLIDKMQSTASSAGTAVANGVRSVMPSPPTPEQAEQARQKQIALNEQLRRQRDRAAHTAARHRVQGQLDRVGAILNAQAAALAEQAARQQQQQINQGNQAMQQQAEQINQTFRNINARNGRN